MIRYGQSESNAGLPTNGPGASPLTALGREQAARTAATFTAPPDLIVGSPFVPSPLARFVLATVHPSSILRAPDAEARHAEMKQFVEDLRKVGRAL